MCGRYSLYIPIDKVAFALGFEVGAFVFAPRYNAAPGQLLPIVTNDNPESIQLFRWGLIPFWAKDPSIGTKMINARCESLFKKPAFRMAAQKRRCLVLSNGFYEWRKRKVVDATTETLFPDLIESGKKKSKFKKVPHHIRLKDGDLICFAGLWEVWRDAEGREIRSFTIITTEANELVSPIHERMPVMLDEAAREKWLDPATPPEELRSLCKPFPPELMEAVKVSKRVNSPANDGPEILIPKEKNPEASGLGARISQLKIETEDPAQGKQEAEENPEGGS